MAALPFPAWLVRRHHGNGAATPPEPDYGISADAGDGHLRWDVCRELLLHMDNEAGLK